MRIASPVPTLLAATLLSCLCTRPVSGEEPAPAAPEVVRLVRVVSDPDAEWDARQSAEQALAKLPARVVLPALVAHMSDQPAGVFYPPAGSATADKDAPPAWQAFYAARRVWNAQTSGDRPAPELAELLPDLLRAARTAEARAAVAAKLATAWSNRAEEPLARLFRDSAEPPAVRGRAAEALLAHYPDRYRNEVCRVADAAPISSQLKQVLFFALTNAPADGARGRQAEPFTVTLGFQLMERSRGRRTRTRHTSSPAGWRFTSISTSDRPTRRPPPTARTPIPTPATGARRWTTPAPGGATTAPQSNARWRRSSLVPPERTGRPLHRVGCRVRSNGPRAGVPVMPAARRTRSFGNPGPTGSGGS